MSKANSPHSNPHADLLRLAQAGDQTAFEALFECYMPLVEAMTARFCAPSCSAQDREDLRQEAMIALGGAVTHYRESSGAASFGTFAKICIRHRLISYLRTSQKHLEVLPLEEHEDFVAEVTQGDPAEHLVEEEAYLELYRNVRKTLSEYENRVWWLYLSGMTAKEVAHLLGSDEKSIQNAIYRIRKKLRQTIPNP